MQIIKDIFANVFASFSIGECDTNIIILNTIDVISVMKKPPVKILMIEQTSAIIDIILYALILLSLYWVFGLLSPFFSKKISSCKICE